MRRVLFGLVSMIAAPLVVFACAGDDPAAPGPKPFFDAALPDVAVPDVDSSTARVVGGCSPGDFVVTAGPNVEITFPTDSTPKQYGNRCVRVLVGSTVTFTGSFSKHPLEPKGGDAPTPITAQNTDLDGGSLVLTMPAKGTFGYDCVFHPQLMFGAIQVVE